MVIWGWFLKHMCLIFGLRDCDIVELEHFAWILCFSVLMLCFHHVWLDISGNFVSECMVFTFQGKKRFSIKSDDVMI